MPNEAFIKQTCIYGRPNSFILPNVTAHDFSTDDLTVTLSGGTIQRHEKYKTQIQIRDDITKAVSADSGSPYAPQGALSAVCISLEIRAAICHHIMGLGLTDLQITTTMVDANFSELMTTLLVGEMNHTIYLADLVSTALPGWDTAIRDIVKNMADVWIDTWLHGIAALSVTNGGTTAEADGDYELPHVIVTGKHQPYS